MHTTIRKDSILGGAGRYSVLMLLILASFPQTGCGQGSDLEAPVYALINGHWFNGQAFAPAPFYVVAGLLTRQLPARVDSVIDLEGRYVVPPYGEAHNHNVDGEAIVQKYLREGIFYVKNPNSLPRTTRPLAGKINTPTSIDVVFSGGGVTASDGHPMGLVKRNIEYEIWTEADGIGAFVHLVDDEAGLERQWPTIQAQRPDFIKTYLLYTEEYAQRKADAAYFAWKGLSPALLAKIVQRAHREDLRVSTHVETATDFHHAVAAGVDEINHMPGFRPREEEYDSFDLYQIAEADAAQAAREGVFVVTTLGGLIRAIANDDVQAERREKIESMVRHNLEILTRHGVGVAIGSDQYRGSSVGEAMALHAFGFFDNLTLLKMWCETTPATIFPDRKIGRLEEGYEASFLVLSGDPLEAFTHTQNIVLRVKQGVILSVDDE